MKIERFEKTDVHVTDMDGQPWFRAAAICEALGIQEVRVAMRRLPTVHKTKLDLRSATGGYSTPANHSRRGGGPEWFVSREGANTLVLGAKASPKAEEMKVWMTRVATKVQRGEMLDVGALNAALNVFGEGLAQRLEARLDAMVSMRLQGFVEQIRYLGDRVARLESAAVQPAHALLAPGETRRLPGAYVVGEIDPKYQRNIREALNILRLPMPERARHILGKRVAAAYRAEAPNHSTGPNPWPPEPINLRFPHGNVYLEQTWDWLQKTVLYEARRMGYVGPAQQLSLLGTA